MEKIFKWFTLEDDLSLVYVNWFTSIFEPSDFKGIERLMFEFLYYCSYLGISAQRKYLEAFLKTDAKTIIKETNIKLDTMSAYDYKEPSALEEAFRIIGKTILETYDIWSSVSVEENNFKVDMKTYLKEEKKKSMNSTMIKYFPMLSDGSDVDEVNSNMQSDLERITLLYDEEKLSEIDFMTGRQHSTSKNQKMRHLFDTGLPCIDGDQGGMWSRMCVTLNGQPGSGKTRILTKHWLYQALVVAKMDVLYDSVEMSLSQIEDMLVAIHIINLYRGTIKIPDKLMTKDMLSTEQRQYYNSAKIDLFESGKYGKLFFRYREPVEKMRKSTLNLLKRNNNLQLWAIDYMGRLNSIPQSKFDRSKQQYEIITEGYEIVHDIIVMCDIGAVVLNQYNDKGIVAALAGKKIQPGYVEGGHIVQRHSDYDLSMTYTEEQKLANVRMISVTKVRGSEGFDNVLLKTDLSVSNFIQVTNKVGENQQGGKKNGS